MNAEDRSSRGSFAGRLLERMFPNASNEPETKEQLIELLRAAKNRALFDTEALSMMEWTWWRVMIHSRRYCPG